MTMRYFILLAMVFGLMGCQSTPSLPAASSIHTLVPEPTVIFNGDRARPYIALTFDACQSPDDQLADYDAAIIDTLTSTKTPATLFLGGLWMQQYSEQTRTLAANPLFELGNYGWSHADFGMINPQEMNREIERTQELMVTLTGRKPVLFRFPRDSYTQEALGVVVQHGLQAVKWDGDSGDRDPGISAESILEEITDQAQNGSIVIMHMNGWGYHTAEALPEVIKQLGEQGYTFVTVSQLLRSNETGVSHQE